MSTDSGCYSMCLKMIGLEIASPASGGLAMTVGKMMAERERFELSLGVAPYYRLSKPAP